jgi:hypothetical protein
MQNLTSLSVIRDKRKAWPLCCCFALPRTKVTEFFMVCYPRTFQNLARGCIASPHFVILESSNVKNMKIAWPLVARY